MKRLATTIASMCVSDMKINVFSNPTGNCRSCKRPFNRDQDGKLIVHIELHDSDQSLHDIAYAKNPHFHRLNNAVCT